MIVTLGGRAGAGKTSVGKALADRLGYDFCSMGDIRRKYAISHGMTIAELNRQAESDPASDRLVDDYQKKMAKTEDNFVIDSRLGFYFIPKSVKVFLLAEDYVRAKRTFEKSRPEERPANIEDALKLLDEREDSDALRYHRLYGVHPFDLKRFDIWVDTSARSVEQTTGLIYHYVKNSLVMRLNRI